MTIQRPFNDQLLGGRIGATWSGRAAKWAEAIFAIGNFPLTAPLESHGLEAALSAISVVLTGGRSAGVASGVKLQFNLPAVRNARLLIAVVEWSLNGY
eukprot:9832920-Lingulodinium_polyedra.AAC.1